MRYSRAKNVNSASQEFHNCTVERLGVTKAIASPPTAVLPCCETVPTRGAHSMKILERDWEIR